MKPGNIIIVITHQENGEKHTILWLFIGISIAIKIDWYIELFKISVFWHEMTSGAFYFIQKITFNSISMVVM